MINQPLQVWESDSSDMFLEVLMSFEDKNDLKLFLRDVMTEKEIIEVGSRLQAAVLLSNNEKYTTIIEQTKLSTRTIARISDWMKNGCGGYEKAIKQIEDHKHM